MSDPAAIAARIISHYRSLPLMAASDWDVLKDRIAREIAEYAGNWWRWQGDGSDRLDSLTCPVSIDAPALSEIIEAGLEMEAERDDAIAERDRLLGLIVGLADEFRERERACVVKTGANMSIRVAQALAEPGGWSPRWLTTDEIEAAEKRWAKRSYRDDVEAKNLPKDDPNYDADDDWIPYQCGGCRFFAAFGADYGVCCCEKSPMDGMITFEHGGCLEHSALTEDRSMPE